MRFYNKSERGFIMMLLIVFLLVVELSVITIFERLALQQSLIYSVYERSCLTIIAEQQLQAIERTLPSQQILLSDTSVPFNNHCQIMTDLPVKWSGCYQITQLPLQACLVSYRTKQLQALYRIHLQIENDKKQQIGIVADDIARYDASIHCDDKIIVNTGQIAWQEFS